MLIVMLWLVGQFADCVRVSNIKRLWPASLTCFHPFRYFLVEKAKNAEVIGIVVGTLGVGKARLCAVGAFLREEGFGSARAGGPEITFGTSGFIPY